jgi:F0F1-type ATP synthase membrane subunit a
MANAVHAFILGLLYICMEIMHVVGIVDDAAGRFLALVGIQDPQWQLYILLVLAAALVTLALRVLGGLLGWVCLLVLVLLLLHRLVPGLASPAWLQTMMPLGSA